MKNVKPYSKLAEIYDNLMDHVDYKKWSNYVKSFFNKADRNIQNILDLSCGTGSLLEYYCKMKYKCIGCDYSLSMIREAKNKDRLKGMPFFNGDAVNIALIDESVDVILFLYDSINYILNEDDLFRLFKDSKRVLRKGGLFIFDIITESLCLKYYKNFYDSEIWGNQGYYRYSYYNEEKKSQINEFSILLNGKLYNEKHKQKIYPIKKIIGYLDTIDFKLCSLTDNFSLREGNEYSERIHFVCKK